jgi:hypothetical protein
MESKLMTQGNITSRYGKIEFVKIYTYQYSPKLLKQKQIKLNLISWLNAKKSLQLFRFTSNGFDTLSPMPDDNWQYNFMGIKQESPPYTHIATYSQYLSQLYHDQLSGIYKKSGPDYIYAQVVNADFRLDLCFNFNVELFDDGRFLIHFSAMSHINLAHPNIQNIIHIIKTLQNSNDQYFPKFQVVDVNSNRSKTVFPLSKQSMDEHDKFIHRFPDIRYSFDYEFMGQYFPKTLSTFMERSKINLTTIGPILTKASMNLDTIDGIKLYEMPLLPIKLKAVKPEMNLMIGSDKTVSKLSASFYSGLFYPVKNGIILPVVYTNDNHILQKTKQLIDNQFNVNGNITWLPAHVLAHNVEDLSAIAVLKKQNPFLFVMIFTSIMIPTHHIQFLRDNRIKYQIMQLPTDQYRLSNFAVKCLHKMGAKVSLIKDLGLKKDAYVVGIDMGHFHGNKTEKGFSTLIMVFYSSHGEYLFTSKVQGLPLNEALQLGATIEALTIFKKHITKTKKNMPSQFVFHRDGKLHIQDVDFLNQSVISTFQITDVNMVEIIKSGYPYMYTHQDGIPQNAQSGQYWEIKDKDYAILITNDQVTTSGEVLKPIVIKRKFGNLPFETIVSQVFWFCKLYTNNIYYPTRLPATTELANNRAGTGVKEYKASYIKD